MSNVFCGTKGMILVDFIERGWTIKLKKVLRKIAETMVVETNILGCSAQKFCFSTMYVHTQSIAPKIFLKLSCTNLTKLNYNDFYFQSVNVFMASYKPENLYTTII